VGLPALKGHTHWNAAAAPHQRGKLVCLSALEKRHVAPLNAAIVFPPKAAPAMLDLNLNREDRILQSPNHLS
jgi:hypothetical protein